MPDPNSGYIGKQEKNLLREVNEKTTQDKVLPHTLNRSELYDHGVQVLESLGVKIQVSENGQFCKHDLYKKDNPPAVKGINYPKEFQPFKKVTDLNEAFDIYENFCSCANDEEVEEFWAPFWIKTNTPSPIQNYSETLLNLERQAFITKVKRNDALDLHHSFLPTLDHFYANPLTWVPAREWFNPKVRELRFKDIFTIFPEAEQKLIQLMLGRIGVGISGHNPPGTDIVVKHTYRMAGVIIGREAGLD